MKPTYIPRPVEMGDKNYKIKKKKIKNKNHLSPSPQNSVGQNTNTYEYNIYNPYNNKCKPSSTMALENRNDRTSMYIYACMYIFTPLVLTRWGSSSKRIENRKEVGSVE
ncbi:unnamed protein product [Ceratitis capitata]|uniref:(Mediterranean fruit fly) hypothetical protein n=1 Tax=Ceratitis capitata TaxID=7213 RepID=A0A811UF20_CERCA|nr:unnamed protein product [Ceratitis capitata]